MQNQVNSALTDTADNTLSDADKGTLLSVISRQEHRIKLLEEALRLERIKRFGQSSEQSQQQENLFDEAEQLMDDVEQQASTTSPIKKTKTKPGRKPFAKDIPRIPVYIDLDEADKAGAIKTFYSKVKEELDIVPAKIQLLEYYQEKAVFAESDDTLTSTVKAATLPKHPLGKSMGSIQLLSHVLISKYTDGLPLHRQENILSRYGGSITRATLANWVIKLAHQLQPLINLLREYQQSSDIIQMDETTVQVLKEPKRAITSNKYMWVSRGGPPQQPSVLFEYDPTRSQAVPLRLLEGFAGYLQTDGYSGYDAVCAASDQIIQLGCWDLARRKFKEAQSAQPNGKKVKPSKADIALSYINKLYVIERQIKAETPVEKQKIRQQQSVPILNNLRQWLDSNLGKVPKDSLSGKAMTYLINGKS